MRGRPRPLMQAPSPCTQWRKKTPRIREHSEEHLLGRLQSHNPISVALKSLRSAEPLEHDRYGVYEELVDSGELCSTVCHLLS